MSQEIIEKIIEQVQSLNLLDVKKLLTRQKLILEQRSESFVLAMKSSDINRLKELVELGVNFQDERLIRKLYDLSLANTNKETFDYLYKLDFKASPLAVESVKGYLRNMKDVNPDGNSTVDVNKLFKYFLLAGIENTLKNYKFIDDVFEIAQTHIEPTKFFEIAKKNAIPNFASFENIGSFTNVHSYIQKYPNELIPILINNIKKEENLNSFLRNPLYKDFLENSIKNDKDGELMISAVGNGSYAKMLTLHKMGVKFPLSKAPYSELFAKTDSLSSDAQKYLINNIDDPTVGNQVILKTLLHAYRDQDVNHERTEVRKALITSLLNRYSKEQLELLPEALKKREPSQLVTLVKKYYDYVALSKEIEESSDNVYEISIRKPKI